MRNVARWMVCLALGGLACVEQPAPAGNAGGASQQEINTVRQRVATRTRPTPQHPMSMTFGGKVELIGYDVNTQELRPGQSVTVTWYWYCRAPVGPGWRLFTHLDDANQPRTNQDSVGDVRRFYQPERWRAGEYIRDTQTFELPNDWDSPTVRMHLGLWKGDERMAATPENATDGQRRARALVLPTGVQIQVAELTAPRASGAITVDGRFDEPAWATAARTGPLVNPLSGGAAGPTDARASARVTWDDQNLYVAYEVQDDNLVDPSTERDNHLWDHDAVELMVDPDGDGANYYELQISPRNQHFDTRYDHARDPAPVGHADWNPAVRSMVVASGTVGNADDLDQGYNVEVAIPWTELNQGLAHTPPQAGDTIRLNLYVMDEDKTGGHRSAAWSAPRRGDFHTLERFGRVTLGPTVVPENSAPPTPTPPTAPTGNTQGGARPARTTGARANTAPR